MDENALTKNLSLITTTIITYYHFLSVGGPGDEVDRFHGFYLRGKWYTRCGPDIPGNVRCPLGRSVLRGLLQIIVQVADNANGQKPQDVKFRHVVFSLEREYTRNVGITILPAAFAADPEPSLTTCRN